MNGFRLDIVSAERQWFSGEVKHLVATGIMGELGIFPGHAPLLTMLQPGQLSYLTLEGQDELFYVSGGMIEVQPMIVTVLADVAQRADDLDEAQALAAQKRAEQALASRQLDQAYTTLTSQLAEAAAQIRVIQQLKRRRHH